MRPAVKSTPGYMESCGDRPASRRRTMARAEQLAGGPKLRPPGPAERGLLPAPQAVWSRRPEVRQECSLEAIAVWGAAPPGVAVELRPGERRADEGGAKRAEHPHAVHA